ncbi:LacI family DNA-binding transcriptional regulator [Caldimonas brevitalea]|nr:substrate-binding domain-containing protein [Caldimonas brevitalea]
MPDLTANDTATLGEVARIAGVSPSTVSRYLNGSARVSEARRQAVEAAIAQLNYRPNMVARSLASGRTSTVGVLTQDIASPFFNEALRGVEDALAESRYAPLFVSGHWNSAEEAERLSLLSARRVDGVVMMHGHIRDEDVQAVARRLPIVMVGRATATLDLPSITVDNRLGAYKATRHLIELGHEDVAFISGPQDHHDAQQRLVGYQDALREAGIVFRESLVAKADFHEATGMLAIHQLLESRASFTAIFAANDQSAYGARLALYRRGIRVPEDVSLVGFDDLPYSSYCVPPLTTVRQPAYEVGWQAGHTVVQMIEGQPYALEPLRVELVVRESTSPRRR